MNQALSRALILSMIPCFCVCLLSSWGNPESASLKTVVDGLERMKLQVFLQSPVASTGYEIGKVLNSLQELSDMLNRDMQASQERSLESAKSLAKLSSEVETAKKLFLRW